MLAHADRDDPTEHAGERAPPRVPAPLPAFREAYADLCSRIWSELAVLDDDLGRAGPSADEDLALRAPILRLELLVLVDACRSARWRLTLLSADQCERMCAMLTDVLAALYVEDDELAAGLADAKDRVLEEFLTETDRQPAATERCRCGRPVGGTANAIGTTESAGHRWRRVG